MALTMSAVYVNQAATTADLSFDDVMREQLSIIGTVCRGVIRNGVPLYSYTGRTKVALVELPTVNMVGFFFCTPFPRRILAWSFVVPRSHSHPPKALKSYIFKRG